MDLKRSDYGRIEGETLPGDQQHEEGISMRGTLTLLTLETRTERVHPTDPDNTSFAI